MKAIRFHHEWAQVIRTRGNYAAAACVEFGLVLSNCEIAH